MCQKPLKHVAFILPGPDFGPVGGYKVVYEYANRLVARGWRVSLVCGLWPSSSDLVRRLFRHPRSSLIRLWRGLRDAARQRLMGIKWFKLDARVRFCYVAPWHCECSALERMPAGTKFVATYITTVHVLNAAKIPNDCKFNLIQDFEAFGFFSEEVVRASYRYSMTNIAISRWLVEEVEKSGSVAAYVPNGLDFDYFQFTTPVEERSRHEIALLWHRDRRKRTEDAVAALELVRGRHPALHVTAFGVGEKPQGLPDWITYVRRPDRERHNRIYNEAAIFVAPSEQEGWGLCPSEAMVCGAAVVCTNAGGYLNFAEDGKTALVSPVRDVSALAKNICRLVEDDSLRWRIAKAGHLNIRQFTWENSVAKLERILGGQ